MDAWIAELAALNSLVARRAWVRANPQFHNAPSLEAVQSAVVELAFSDWDRAERLAAAAQVLAAAAADPNCEALALRCAGHVRFARADYAAALENYRKAIAILERGERDLDLARALNGALQSLIYLGRFDEALKWAERASQIFEKHGDRLRMARLAINVGNILYRQDRHAEAIDRYQSVLEPLRQFGEPRDVAAALSNIAVCATSLGDFRRALDTYTETRRYCVDHSMPVLVAAADYNIAYLHYLRGDYVRAIELYRLTRAHCEQVGDSYHAALCDLDESEMYLELNLTADGERLARRAADRFDKLGMGYERGKAIVNRAVAQSQAGNPQGALRLFRAARALLIAQQNAIWPALVDHYQAILAHRVRDNRQAAQLNRRAYRVLRDSTYPGKAVQCELLEAQLRLDSGDIEAARRICVAAQLRFTASDAPAGRFQSAFLLGRIEESRGNPGVALEHYSRARLEVESLRARLWGENSRISFLKDKLVVYQRLVALLLDRGDTELAFECIEQAKSRSMAEALMLPGAPNLAPDVAELRRELNWYYRQMELASLLRSSGFRSNFDEFHRAALQREEEIARRMTAAAGAASLDDAPGLSIAQLRAALPPGTQVLEYFEASGTFLAAVLDSQSLSIHPVAKSAEVLEHFRFLRFQLAKFQMNPGQSAGDSPVLYHLQRLYQLLIYPIRHRLTAGHLVVVPHSFLHQLPFHALHDGHRHFTDSFSLSYAPSASVLALCRSARAAHPAGAPLVMGVPDELAPQIDAEARAVAAALPGSTLLLGEQATEESLRNLGPDSKLIHIATHGLFRRDNPMFSSIRLADGHLSLVDLYRMRLKADLVTLSGCSTGLNAVVEGDELLGLVRGLLCAGARGAVLSLWDVNDSSVTGFMQAFYSAMALGRPRAEALKTAMRIVRDSQPHPYYWAPFVLVGEFS